MSAILTLPPPHEREHPFDPFEEGRRYTYEEYRLLEEQSEIKHTFWDGEVIAMSGGTSNHSILAVLFLGLLIAKLEDATVYNSDMAVRLRGGEKRTAYPDITIVAGKPEFEDERQLVVLNPTVIIEVLSPSTEAEDRGKKFVGCRQIPTLQEYVLADPREQRIELFRRGADETWTLYTFAGPDAVLHLASVDARLPLKDLYARLDLGAA